MHHTMTDQKMKELLQNLKQGLEEFPSGSGTLESKCEASAKHIPTYLKIVKGHITQLAQILKMDSHQNRSLENTALAEPVQQLIQIFNTLHEDDLALFESLAVSARHWEEEQTAKIFDYANATEA